MWAEENTVIYEQKREARTWRTAKGRLRDHVALGREQMKHVSVLIPDISQLLGQLLMKPSGSVDTPDSS